MNYLSTKMPSFRKSKYFRGFIALAILTIVYIVLSRQPKTTDEVSHTSKSIGDFRDVNSVVKHTREKTSFMTQICADQNLFILIYVHSDVKHFANRANIRSTWGSTHAYPKVKMQVVFVVSQPEDRGTLTHIRKESQRFQDIIMLPFTEQYSSIALKSISSIHLVADNCKHVPFVIKIDDDIVANVFSILDYLQHDLDPTSTDRRLLMCCMWPPSSPFRNKSHKWYASYEMYPNKCYPEFCSGSTWIMSIDTVLALSRVSWNNTLYPYDDVWITGMLAQKAGIKHVQLRKQYRVLKNDVTDRGIVKYYHGPDPVIFHAPTHEAFHILWNNIAAGSPVKLQPQPHIPTAPCIE